MKKTFIGIILKSLKALAGGFALLALLAFVLPQAAQSATSGGATIYNTVKVTYIYNSTLTLATAHVRVTVNTVAALPAITNPAGRTVLPSSLVTYNYIIKSNSNGPDTYTTTASSLTNTPTGVSAATGPSVTASISLWGGIVIGSGAGTIIVPNGSTTGLTAGVSTVQIGASTYTVAAINPGAAAYTDGSGNLVAEVPATLTLTPIGASPAITAGSVAAGTQIGEFKNTLTVTFTTGTLTVAGTAGTYSTTFSISTGALPTVLSNTTTAVITTVTVDIGRAVITKYVRNVSVPSGSGTPYNYNGANYYPAGVTAKPGDILEYILVATNTGSIAISASVITDVQQTNFVTFRDNAYGAGKEITYVSDSNVVTTLTKVFDVDQADYNITTLNTLTVYAGTGATNIAGGTIPAGRSVLVLYQVTVSNPVQGDKIINSAQLSSSNMTPVTSEVTVTVNINMGQAVITTYVRNVSVPNGSGTPYNYSGANYYPTAVTAKPGDILEYILVAANTGSTAISASVITDVPQINFSTFRDNAYGTGKEITYVSDSDIVTTLTKVLDGDQADYNITTLNTLTVYAGTGATNIAGGTIPAGKRVLVLYQVTVNN